ncbi:MAG TPA: hypothetical protein VFU81_19890 [Thermomicrobiales bacterium]|nr:hypothetical protein [Thermomicrobiales bacterium]
MRIVRDVGYIKKKKRLATLAAMAGVALLGSAFWLATAGNPNAVLIAYAPLLAGTLVFHFGMQQVAKWNRTPRDDEALDAVLKGLGDRYGLVHYSTLGKRVVEHALVHPGGILTITVRDTPGTIEYRNGRWRKTGGGFSRLFGLGGPQIGNPNSDAAADVAAVEAATEAARMAVDVDGAIVFLSPRVQLDVEEPDFPVTNADGLLELIRTLPVDSSLSANDRKTLVDLLATGEQVEQQQPAPRRRPVKRRAA